MLEKLALVMGIRVPADPDPSYVLTIDNVMKMLAIYMRFRLARFAACFYVIKFQLYFFNLI